MPEDERGGECIRCIRHGSPRPRNSSPTGDSAVPDPCVEERKRRGRRFPITSIGSRAWVFDGYPIMHWAHGDLYRYLDIDLADGVIPEFREITSAEKNVIGDAYLGHFASSIIKKRICSVDGCTRKQQAQE